MGVTNKLRFNQCPPTYNGTGFYVIEFECGGVKVGIAKILIQRLKTYKAPWMKKITRIKCYSSKNPFQIEQCIKKQFSRMRAKGSSEFFVVPFEKIIKAVETNPFHQRGSIYALTSPFQEKEEVITQEEKDFFA